MDEDEAAAAADFTPMTEEKRTFVNEWIAKLGEDVPDEQAPIEVGLNSHQTCTCMAPVTWHLCMVPFSKALKTSYYMIHLNHSCKML